MMAQVAPIYAAALTRVRQSRTVEEFERATALLIQRVSTLGGRKLDQDQRVVVAAAHARVMAAMPASPLQLFRRHNQRRHRPGC